MSDKVLVVGGVEVARHLVGTRVRVTDSCFWGTSFLAAEEAPEHCYKQIKSITYESAIIIMQITMKSLQINS